MKTRAKSGHNPEESINKGFFKFTEKSLANSYSPMGVRNGFVMTLSVISLANCREIYAIKSILLMPCIFYLRKLEWKIQQKCSH